MLPEYLQVPVIPVITIAARDHVTISNDRDQAAAEIDEKINSHLKLIAIGGSYGATALKAAQSHTRKTHTVHWYGRVSDGQTKLLPWDDQSEAELAADSQFWQHYEGYIRGQLEAYPQLIFYMALGFFQPGRPFDPAVTYNRSMKSIERGHGHLVELDEITPTDLDDCVNPLNPRDLLLLSFAANAGGERSIDLLQNSHLRGFGSPLDYDQFVGWDQRRQKIQHPFFTFPSLFDALVATRELQMVAQTDWATHVREVIRTQNWHGYQILVKQGPIPGAAITLLSSGKVAVIPFAVCSPMSLIHEHFHVHVPASWSRK